MKLCIMESPIEVFGYMHPTFFGPDLSPVLKEDSRNYISNWIQTSPLMRCLDRPLDLPKCFLKFRSWVVVGTGGSTLGAQTLASLAPSPHLKFLDSIDPWTIQQTLYSLEKATTGFLVVSKSGETVETLRQYLELDPAHVVVMTQNDSSSTLNQAHLCEVEHPHDVGGRFSVFSPVGQVPASLLGLNWDKFCQGAKDALTDANTDTFLIHAGRLANLLSLGFSEHILWLYGDRLKAFGAWWSQLWAESLGKKNTQGIPCGTTPILALGPQDQHSALQLYLDGPRNKFFTMIHLEETESERSLNYVGNQPLLKNLASTSLSKLMQISFESTKETLAHQDCPGRSMTLHRSDEYTLGYLMMNAIAEVVMVAHLLDICPFDQPAVEDVKKRILSKIHNHVAALKI